MQYAAQCGEREYEMLDAVKQTTGQSVNIKLYSVPNISIPSVSYTHLDVYKRQVYIITRYCGLQANAVPIYPNFHQKARRLKTAGRKFTFQALARS